MSGFGVKLGTIRFDEIMNPDTPKYAFENSALNKDTIDATWVFPANSTFLTPLMEKLDDLMAYISRLMQIQPSEFIARSYQLVCCLVSTSYLPKV